ncbi:hypothetical protein Taro_039409, partial [Colocasia esculenta]|nr:hypothetical protein [Colocasia esculenta]
RGRGSGVHIGIWTGRLHTNLSKLLLSSLDPIQRTEHLSATSTSKFLHVDCVPHAVVHHEVVHLDPRELARGPGSIGDPVPGRSREARHQRERRQGDSQEGRDTGPARPVGVPARRRQPIVLAPQGALVEDAGTLPAPVEPPLQSTILKGNAPLRERRKAPDFGVRNVCPQQANKVYEKLWYSGRLED